MTNKEPEHKEELANDQEETDMKRAMQWLILAQGGNPFAQSGLEAVLKMDTPQERTNLPTPISQQKQTYLLMCEKFFGPKYGKPFKDMALADANCWSGYKGFTKNSAVEMLKKGTDFGNLIVNPPTQQHQTKKDQQHKEEELE